jgi:hypothetical protein
VTRDPRAKPSTTIQPLAISVAEAARRLELSRSQCYQACSDFLNGKPHGVPCIRVRSRVLVPLASLESFPQPQTQAPEISEGVRRVK